MIKLLDLIINPRGVKEELGTKVGCQPQLKPPAFAKSLRIQESRMSEGVGEA